MNNHSIHLSNIMEHVWEIVFSEFTSKWLNRSRWLEVLGRNLTRQRNGESSALGVTTKWSEASKVYPEGETERKWASSPKDI
jgi:hypothetical protein